MGTREGKVYTLLVQSPGLPEYQYDPESRDQMQSFYTHTADGFAILQDFVTRNGLTPDPDWEIWYQNNLIAPAEADLAALTPRP